ncbi:DUF3501 family protein [Vulcanisaeta souniana]|uniref:DUF3501 family protein n=1 Tax=Vulcanisaeta souniana JCM 11219 TaxID=1293586 RepID=A0A830EEW4_9CREN|nr:DUF3501 family protein [Vulcanisaeta souniana]BDR93220.1 hypothetical protein Vsou_23130 [Vulcanisaeta souniana JCM 11219]GGI78502.1 hypothetical protein GCM10007112_14210 [Vulcanisaeta souniana JCM 11219]
MESDLLKIINRVYPPSQYSGIRERVYELISNYKANRYVKVDDRVTVLFEDAATVWFQIEEAVYLEGVDDDAVLKEAIRTYSPMVPRKDEVSLTVFVHVFNYDEMRNLLPKYNGIENSVNLVINDHAIPAKPIYPEDYGPDALPRSIHYLKISEPGLDLALKQATAVAISVMHPMVNKTVKLTDRALESLKYLIKDIQW